MTVMIADTGHYGTLRKFIQNTVNENEKKGVSILRREYMVVVRKKKPTCELQMEDAEIQAITTK